MSQPSRDDAFRERLRVSDKVRKLLAIAEKHPDTPEGKSAREKAGLLIAKYNLDAASLRPKIDAPKFDYNSAVMKAMMAAFPGRDTTDYTKYDPETGKLKEGDPRDE
jgi:hypothetical protein